MPRFFQQQGAPLSFEVSKQAGVSPAGTRAAKEPKTPTDEQIKRAAMRLAVADGTTTTPVMTDSPASEGDVSEPSGMSVNTGTKPIVDTDKVGESLTRQGYGDVFLTMQKDQADLEEKKQDLSKKQLDNTINHIVGSVQAVYSGNQKLAIDLANRVTKPGEEVTGFKVLDDNNFVEYTKDKPDGNVLKRSEVDKMALDAKSRLQILKPGFKTMTVNGRQVMYTENQLGEPKHFATIEPGPYDTKAAEDAAKAVGESNIAVQKAAEAQVGLNNATKAFTDHLAAGGGTGTRYAAGVVRGVPGDFDKAQNLNVAIKKLNLATLVTQFHGMTQAVNSETERKAFEAAQYDISNQETVLSSQFVGGIKLSVAGQAEELAKQKYYSTNKTTSEYESPVIGKQQVLFSPKGEATLVSNDSVASFKKQGYMDGDAAAQKLLSKKDRVTPFIGPNTMVSVRNAHDSEYEYKIENGKTFKKRKQAK